MLNCRFEIGAKLAARTGATVLLKGVPTVITAPSGASLVSASGTPILAAAGSGDILSGIAGTMLTQTTDALSSGAVAAWIHGHAAELVVSRNASRTPLHAPATRGHSLDDVLDALSLGWPVRPAAPRYPVLFELAPVGDRP